MRATKPANKSLRLRTHLRVLAVRTWRVRSYPFEPAYSQRLLCCVYSNICRVLKRVRFVTLATRKRPRTAAAAAAAAVWVYEV